MNSKSEVYILKNVEIKVLDNINNLNYNKKMK